MGYFLMTAVLLSVSVTGFQSTVMPTEQTQLPNTPDLRMGRWAEEEKALQFLNDFNEKAGDIITKAFCSMYGCGENLEGEETEASGYGFLMDTSMETVSKFNRTAVNPETWRQLQLILHFAFYQITLKDPERNSRLQLLKYKLYNTYFSAKICEQPDSICYSLDPDLTDIMAASRNYSELSWAWQGFREYFVKAASYNTNITDDYARLVELQSEASRQYGYKDFSDLRRGAFAMDNIQETVQNIYEQVKPLYLNLYAYVRRKLYNRYGSDVINLRGPIPAHLFGDMMAEYWNNLIDDMLPYPDSPTPDIAKSFAEQNYTVRNMFELADGFFTSLGMEEVPPLFWNLSTLEKPKGATSWPCHGGATDFYDGERVMISMCTDQTMTDFVILHHEMGHIQYFLQYKDLPIIFKQGANPAFHEAVGDVISLSVNTMKHLKAVGLIAETVGNDAGTSLNFLMEEALWRIPRVPFDMVMLDWQTGVYDGSIPKDDYNTEWWKLRLMYQGLIPPVERSKYHCDYLSSFHNAATYSYHRYFFSNFIAFQFHDALCNASGHEGPFHECDFYQSTEAGNLFSETLKLGSSLPWEDTMEFITGQRSMSAEPFLRYFKPLSDWLMKVNEENGEVLNWEETDWKPGYNAGNGFSLCEVNVVLMSFIIAAMITGFF